MNLDFFHTYNRGVEKREIFCDEGNYLRGVHDIYEFNNVNVTLNFSYRLKNENYQYPISIDKISIDKKQGEPLIDLFVWCLMPNHLHFFSRPRLDNGLAKFHQKLGIGYTNYFNLQNNRSGVLFQGKYKKVKVTNDVQAGHLVCYIHSNLLDVWKPNWKERRLTSFELQNALDFLENKENRWSSHQDYLGIKNFPSLINTEFLYNFFGGPAGYRKFFTDWLKQYETNIQFLHKLTLDR